MRPWNFVEKLHYLYKCIFLLLRSYNVHVMYNLFFYENIIVIIISIKVQKRQALIPFPRTGKRANLPTIHKMEDSSVEEIPEYLIGQPKM